MPVNILPRSHCSFQSVCWIMDCAVADSADQPIALARCNIVSNSVRCSADLGQDLVTPIIERGWGKSEKGRKGRRHFKYQQTLCTGIRIQSVSRRRIPYHHIDYVQVPAHCSPYLWRQHIQPANERLLHHLSNYFPFLRLSFYLQGHTFLQEKNEL